MDAIPGGTSYTYGGWTQTSAIVEKKDMMYAANRDRKKSILLAIFLVIGGYLLLKAFSGDM